MRGHLDWSQIEKRFRALWQREIVDRCCISVFAPKDPAYFTQEVFPEDARGQERYWFDGEVVLERNLQRIQHTCYYGDAYPGIFLNLGASGHAGYFKGVRHRLDQRTVWFFPTIYDWEQDVLQFDPVASLYRKTLDLADFLCRESRGRYFVSMPDIAGNLDALAHLRGSENLLVDLLVNGRHVRQALAIIQEAWSRTNREVHKIVRANNHGGCTIGWLHTWAPGFHAQLQCDLSVMISQELFAEYVMEELQAQSALLDYPLYHLDGIDQLRHLDMILSIEGLKMVQWTCVEGQPPPIHFLPQLKRIQAAGKGLLIKIEPAWLVPLMEELSSKGLYLVVQASSPTEGVDMLKTATNLTHD